VLMCMTVMRLAPATSQGASSTSLDALRPPHSDVSPRLALHACDVQERERAELEGGCIKPHLRLNEPGTEPA